jgi:hypothetical protein
LIELPHGGIDQAIGGLEAAVKHLRQPRSQDTMLNLGEEQGHPEPEGGQSRERPRKLVSEEMGKQASLVLDK